MQSRSAILLFCLCLTALFASCAGSELERAFRPKMESRESNKTISEYCTTCHTHKDFEPKAHIQSRDDNNVASAGVAECRTCHTYIKTWLLDVRRKTLRHDKR